MDRSESDLSEDVFSLERRAQLRALLEAAIFAAPEPLPLKQMTVTFRSACVKLWPYNW